MPGKGESREVIGVAKVHLRPEILANDLRDLLTLETKGDLIGAAHAWAERKGLGQLGDDLSALFKFIDKKFGTRLEEVMKKLRLEVDDLHYLQNIADTLVNDITTEELGKQQQTSA